LAPVFLHHYLIGVGLIAESTMHKKPGLIAPVLFCYLNVQARRAAKIALICNSRIFPSYYKKLKTCDLLLLK
jgi:hypothetical protein